MPTNSRRLACALSIVVAGLALAAPAGAQFAGGRSAFNQRPSPEPVQLWGDRRNFYPRFGATAARPIRTDPTIRTIPYRRQQVYESIKPPAPRKTETPPAETVVVIGDSFAEWLAYGLEQVFAETPQIGIVRKIKPDLGLVRDDARLDAPEWTQAIKDLLPATEKPNAIVVMLGVNDRSPLRERAPAAKEPTSPSDT